MSLLSARLGAGLKRLETLAGPGTRDVNGTLQSQTFTWQGASYACLASSLKRGTVIVVGGKEVEISLTLFVRKEVLPTQVTVDSLVITADSTAYKADNMSAPPRSGNKLTHRNITYRVAAVAEVAGGSHWEIDLMDVNR